MLPFHHGLKGPVPGPRLEQEVGHRTRYNEVVLDHYERPRNVGVVEDADADATVSNPTCGDTVRLTLRIRNTPCFMKTPQR